MNPATFLAEIQVFQADNRPEDKLNVGPLEYTCQQTLQQVLHDYSDICASSQTEIGRTTLITHKINTGNAAPIAQKPYRMNPENEKFLNEEVGRLLESGIIRKSYSPWASPVVIVGKKGGDKRLCIDYRKLNAETKVDSYPLPRIDDLLNSLEGAIWFTTLNLASGY